MPNPVETILTSIGIPAEDIPAITTLPEDQHEKFDAKPFVEKVKSNYTKQLQNDPAFFNDMTIEKLPQEIVKKIESAQFQRSANIMKGKLMKGLGLTDADLGDLTDEEKEKLESYVTAVANKYTKTKASDKQVQAELIEARKKIEEFGGLEDRLKTKYETESQKTVSGAIFNAVLLAELSAIPGLKIAASDIAKTANEILQSKYSYERVGDFSVELRQKNNPAMKVLKEGSSHELTLKDALVKIATERGWIAEEEEEDENKNSGSGKFSVKPGGGKLKMHASPHVQDKISRKIKAEQE